MDRFLGRGIPGSIRKRHAGKQSNTVEVKNRLDLTGYEVVRAQYFATLQNPAMTISNGRLRFNAACLKKFDDVEYVELLLNSVDRCIAIRPCEKSNPNAIRWGRLKEGRWCANTLGCRGLAKALFDIMEWDEDLKYRFRGQLVEQGGDKLMLFELDQPEMIKVEEIVLPPKEEESEGETVKKDDLYFPTGMGGDFWPANHERRTDWYFAAGALCRQLGCTSAGIRN